MSGARGPDMEGRLTGTPATQGQATSRTVRTLASAIGGGREQSLVQSKRGGEGIADRPISSDADGQGARATAGDGPLRSAACGTGQAPRRGRQRSGVAASSSRAVVQDRRAVALVLSPSTRRRRAPGRALLRRTPVVPLERISAASTGTCRPETRHVLTSRPHTESGSSRWGAPRRDGRSKVASVTISGGAPGGTGPSRTTRPVHTPRCRFYLASRTTRLSQRTDTQARFPRLLTKGGVVLGTVQRLAEPRRFLRRVSARQRKEEADARGKSIVRPRRPNRRRGTARGVVNINSGS